MTEGLSGVLKNFIDFAKSYEELNSACWKAYESLTGV